MADTFEQTMSTLDALLAQQLDQHEQLGELIENKRQAMLAADATRMTELCELENQRIQAISELEKQRLKLVAKVTLMLRPNAAEPMRMKELAEHLPAPYGDKLMMRYQMLKTRMEKIKQQTSVARRATESLVKHMQGLIHTIGAVSTGVSTYAQNGARPKEALAVSTLSVTA